jgi:uncharacterized protein (TIGR01777 family)
MSRGVLLTGGYGLIGSQLKRQLQEKGFEVRGLTRRKPCPPNHLWWNGINPPLKALEGVRSVVHLSGQPIFGGIPKFGNRRKIFTSRIESTRALVDAMRLLSPENRPEVFICASAVGYYGDRGDDLLTEDAGPGHGYLSRVCQSWEQEALNAEALGIRTVRLRIGVVLSKLGGALPNILVPFRAGLGGPLGNGRQWFSWIHIQDLVSLIVEALQNQQYAGAINAVAPRPIRNSDFTKSLAHCLGKPAFIRVPKIALYSILGSLAGDLLASQRVASSTAEHLGFRFLFPEVSDALSRETQSEPTDFST